MNKIIVTILSTVLIVCFAVAVVNINRVGRLNNELIVINTARSIEQAEHEKLLENYKLAKLSLIEKKEKLITKYIPISTSELQSCEAKLRAIESSQKIYFEVQR